MPTINIIGAGKLGWTLAKLLPTDRYDVRLISRDDTTQPANITILAVRDGQIEKVARTITNTDVLLHCSGALNADVLRPHPVVGSLHPLMTFPGAPHDTPCLAGVPMAIDGDDQAMEVATELALALGMKPFHFQGDRTLYHAAAVMAGNFTGHLYSTATELLRAAGVPADIVQHALLPLTLSSANNAANCPQSAQTGPAARGDSAVIAAHLSALTSAGLADALSIYTAITDSISVQNDT